MARAAGALVVVVASVAPAAAAGASAPSTEWVSVSRSGESTDDSSFATGASATGRYVAFHSYASDVTPGDENDLPDVFVRDVVAGTTVRVSVSASGGDPNGRSLGAAVSANGRFVAFYSEASNLVRADRNGVADVFVRDVVVGRTTRITVDAAGGDANGPASGYPSISADGRFVAFDSAASDLVAGDGNRLPDVFVRDLVRRTTVRVSVDMAGGDADGKTWPNPDISASGRHVAFESRASDLVPGDGNGIRDVFVRDMVDGVTKRVSVDTNGRDANRPSQRPSVSADGRFVAFDSSATDLVPDRRDAFIDVFVRDLATATTTQVSVAADGGNADSASLTPAISDDGRRVAFRSLATVLVPGDDDQAMDVFVRDLVSATTIRVSPGSGASEIGDIAGDGRAVAFSTTTPLFEGDVNGVYDAFLRHLR